ncbi:MAG: BtaA family protein [Pirellulales bacterium]|nr:BtaA family protein [Pirellulales bacterium]
MLTSKLNTAWFRLCHGRNLVYNTCWEDPRLDRQALAINEFDDVLVITSAGCNVLDYALDEPNRVFAIDVNPRQNALLELKIAAIRELDFDAFFEIFGRGYHPRWHHVYRQHLRHRLSVSAQRIWDRHGRVFCGSRRRSSFYYCGTSGMFAWLVKHYVDHVAKIRPQLDRMLATESLAEQQEIYESKVKPAFWGPMMRWVLRRDAVLALLGVPKAQRKQLERYYPGGVSQFVEDRLDRVFGQMPLVDNYFWRVYLTGEYTHDCCPEYLRRENFHRLKAGLVDRVSIHTCSILEFLQQHRGDITRFVLLDHMDWLADHQPQVLAKQWQAIVDRATPGARFLWRSAAMEVEFLEDVCVTVNDRRRRLQELMQYHQGIADQLHAQDRVNTYGSFYIADYHPDSAMVRAGEGHERLPDERSRADEDAVSLGSVADSR